MGTSWLTVLVCSPTPATVPWHPPQPLVLARGLESSALEKCAGRRVSFFPRLQRSSLTEWWPLVVFVRTPFHAQNGETFIVTDADKLAEEELPKYAITSEIPCLVDIAYVPCCW